MTCGIYEILGPNGKRYVGQTIDFTKRKGEHFRSLRRNMHKCRHLQAAFNKHGEQAFKFRIIERCHADKLTEREQFYMTGKLYNTAPAAGSLRGIKRTPEFIERMRQARLGQIISLETRERLRQALKGRKQPQSEIDNRRAAISTKVVLANGKEYPTIQEFARACGYKYRAAVTNALARGHSFDRIAQRRGLL